MDWDKLRIFHAAAEAGSFTHAGEVLGLSQSAVSRQVSALEQDMQVPLFHRHARGLILTEQGEVLFRTVQDVTQKLEAARMRLSDNRERPHGELRITTTVGIGTNWLTPRLGEFLELYPDIKVNVILSDSELDLAMREADVALRVREPVQPDLIRRRLFTMHFHAYAAASYLKRHGQPRTLEDLDRHRILAYGVTAGSYLNNINSLAICGAGCQGAAAVGADDQQHHRPAARRGAWRRHCRAARLPRRGRCRARAIIAAGRHAGTRLLSRLSGRIEECRAGAGLPRFPRRRRPALGLLARVRQKWNPVLRPDTR